MNAARLAPLTVIALGLLLGACSSAPQLSSPEAAAVVPPTSSTSSTAGLDARRQQVIFAAVQQVGVPYRWGGATPDGFDCSGLVYFAYRNAGIGLPRTAADQQAASRPIGIDRAEPGDLLFFREGSRTSHVAIYLGEGRFVHAPRTGSQVSLDDFGTDYWKRTFVGAGRLIQDFVEAAAN